MKPNIADFIRSRVEEAPGMSFRKLEMLSGVSRSEISCIINKKRKKPSPEVLRNIAPYLKVSYEYLLFLSDYLSETSWLAIEIEFLKNQRKNRLTGEKIKNPEAIYHSLGLLSSEEKAILCNFKMIKDKKAKSTVVFFIQLALKAERGRQAELGSSRDKR